MPDDANTEIEAQRAVNPFVINPFRPLSVDPGRYVPDEVYRAYIQIVNAISYFLRESLNNRNDIIDLGLRKGEAYDANNKRRYEIEASIEALKVKDKALDRLFRIKEAEVRHLKRSVLG